MKRLLRSRMQLKQQRYYNYDPQSRSLVGNPEEVPPPIHFKIQLLPDAIPQTGHGFQHFEEDPYMVDAVTTYDNWEYRYYGQWWDIGSFGCNLFWALFPALLYLHLDQQNTSAGLRKDVQWKKYFTQGGSFQREEITIKRSLI